MVNNNVSVGSRLLDGQKLVLDPDGTVLYPPLRGKWSKKDQIICLTGLSGNGVPTTPDELNTTFWGLRGELFFLICSDGSLVMISRVSPLLDQFVLFRRM